jgi:hypothetical protein
MLAEPTLFPRLQIYFADFPSLFYTTYERLLTLETWCGYWYELNEIINYKNY